MKKKYLFASLFLSLATSAYANKAPTDKFTQEQQNQIGKIAEDYFSAHPEKASEAISLYLAEHPEFLVAAEENLRQRQQFAQQQTLQQMAMLHQQELLSPNSPSIGPKNARVAVIMFFDYQCAYCSKITPAIEATMQQNPKVRFIFKERPILASRWPVSGYAARVAQKIWQEKGGKAYLSYNNALYATGHVEGKLTSADVNSAAAPYLSPQQLKTLVHAETSTAEVAVLSANAQLAQQLNITETPAFVVLPQSKKPQTSQIFVSLGSTTEDALQNAIIKASAD
ncbi:thioredoxin domain-containing protein [Klebsiella aerogenes]|uniref:thioredoxin domain-containing protein n=1 Tax=Klebsiella aerogenes TaxID=548 RepID=UPI0021D35540|nr:thioredoxin domain-containing protein [Klebsiella aerogenes]MCU6317034.1 thioredoxin domain-containing protein [Klebsiella aerogenes]